MGFKLSAAVSIARGVLQDSDPDGYRYSDPDLVAYGNGAIRALVGIKPGLFYTESDFACTENAAKQSLSFDDAHALIDVLRINNGNAVLRADKAALDAFMPSWMTGSPGTAVNWMPNIDDPVGFYLYPPAPANQVLRVLYVRVPATYAMDDDTGLPETITEAVADYMVGMAESRNDEAANSGRATQFINQFAARIGGGGK